MASEKQTSKSGSMVCSKMQSMEDNLLLDELKACGGNQLQAAKNLGISYSTFKRKYKKLRNK
jgi:DNA-binding NtrC family response regulator